MKYQECVIDSLLYLIIKLSIWERKTRNRISQIKETESYYYTNKYGVRKIHDTIQA